MRRLNRTAEAQARRQIELINEYCWEAANEIEIGEEEEEVPVAQQVVDEEAEVQGVIEVPGFEAAEPPIQQAVVPAPAVRVSEKRRKLPKRGLLYATRVGFEARAQVGLLERTRANFLVYQRICRDIMKEHGVRPTHIAAALPVAISAAFTPSDVDIVSSRAMSGAEVSKRHRLLGGFNGC
jgi:hypothetical protein